MRTISIISVEPWLWFGALQVNQNKMENVTYLLLKSNKDLGSSISHQALLDFLQKKLLDLNFPIFNKEFLIDLSNDLGDFILPNTWKKNMLCVSFLIKNLPRLFRNWTALITQHAEMFLFRLAGKLKTNIRKDINDMIFFFKILLKQI